jgi:hypothetical protein
MKGAGGRRRIVPKCAKLGNYWGNFDINSGYTLYQMIDKYHKRKTKDYVIITETLLFLTREYDPDMNQCTACDDLLWLFSLLRTPGLVKVNSIVLS